MKKIVILCLHLGTGGIERAITSLANILCEQYEVKIISTYKINKQPAFHIDNRVKIEYLLDNLKPNKEELKDSINKRNIKKILKELIKSLKVLFFRRKKMVGAIKKLDCDIAITTRDIHNKWLGKYGDKNIIKIAQEHNHHNNNKRYIKKVVKSLNRIDYFMPVSKQLTNYYNQVLKSKKTKTVFITNFLENYPNKTSSLQCKQLLSVGRLSPEKGFLDLVDVFNIVSRKYPDWSLKIVGDGLQRLEIENKIKELNLQSKIKLTGFKDKQELEKIELDSSIYVMTSFTESFGLVLIEAESYGLPIVVFDTAQGANEIVQDGINGYLISKRDKIEMANKIINLIEDYSLRCKLGQQGRKLSEQYKKQNISEKWYEFIENCKKQ